MARPKKDAEDKEVKTRKKIAKKVKDPNAPKRPQSAYFLWLAENRDRIKQENPEAKMTDVAKIAGKEWATVGDKSKWEKLNAQAKEDYAAAMESYDKNAAVAASNSD